MTKQQLPLNELYELHEAYLDEKEQFKFTGIKQERFRNNAHISKAEEISLKESFDLTGTTEEIIYFLTKQQYNRYFDTIVIDMDELITGEAPEGEIANTLSKLATLNNYEGTIIVNTSAKNFSKTRLLSDIGIGSMGIRAVIRNEFQGVTLVYSFSEKVDFFDNDETTKTTIEDLVEKVDFKGAHRLLLTEQEFNLEEGVTIRQRNEGEFEIQAIPNEEYKKKTLDERYEIVMNAIKVRSKRNDFNLHAFKGEKEEIVDKGKDQWYHIAVTENKEQKEKARKKFFEAQQRANLWEITFYTLAEEKLV